MTFSKALVSAHSRLTSFTDNSEVCSRLMLTVSLSIACRESKHRWSPRIFVPRRGQWTGDARCVCPGCGAHGRGAKRGHRKPDQHRDPDRFVGVFVVARERREAGMATAELAMVIPAVLLVLAMCLTGLSVAADQIRCVDAARAAARAASRGESLSDVRRVALRLTPSGTRVEIEMDKGRGIVAVAVQAPAPTRLLPGLPAAQASAQAPLEPALDGDR